LHALIGGIFGRTVFELCVSEDNTVVLARRGTLIVLITIVMPDLDDRAVQRQGSKYVADATRHPLDVVRGGARRIDGPSLAPTALVIDTVAGTASADVAQVAGTMRPLAEHSLPRSMSADARITRIDIIGAPARRQRADAPSPTTPAGWRWRNSARTACDEDFACCRTIRVA
jgi:hypothetical protein